MHRPSHHASGVPWNLPRVDTEGPALDSGAKETQETSYLGLLLFLRLKGFGILNRVPPLPGLNFPTRMPTGWAGPL